MASNTDTDWTFGDPCPNCDSRTVNYVEKIGRTLVPGDDDEVVDAGVYYADGIEVTCDDCGTHLSDSVGGETVNVR